MQQNVQSDQNNQSDILTELMNENPNRTLTNFHGLITKLQNGTADIHDLCHAINICITGGWSKKVFKIVYNLALVHFNFNIKLTLEKKGQFAGISTVVLNDLDSNIYHPICHTPTDVCEKYHFYLYSEDQYFNDYYKGLFDTLGYQCTQSCEMCWGKETELGIYSIRNYSILKQMILGRSK